MFSPRYWSFLLIIVAAIVYSVIRHVIQEPVVEPATEPAQTPEVAVSAPQEDTLSNSDDPYQYRYLTLDNGLKVLLVSTPDTDKAAAALTVDAGSADDPAGREGLAHFLEHMLFLGTDPYPDAGEYQAFMSRHGGSHNAFTAYNQTTYFFSINNDALSDALDRFAPFFISPRFDEAYVDREKNAVNAEYSAKLKEDFRRIFSAEKQAMNPQHPYSHFSVGNLDTLADRPDSKVRDDLVQFYQQHYSADRMTLVLAANYPLDQLQEWATTRFAAVPDRQIAARSAPEPMFQPGQLPLDLNVEPVKEIRRLQFTFPMPESLSLYQNKPIQLLTTLLGHEGEGSILALLKQKGWAESLTAGSSLATTFESNIVVQIELTMSGLLHVDDITRILDQYISLLKQGPLPDYLMTEQQQLAQLAFRFREQEDISDYVVRLSSNMLVYPQADIIRGDYKWQPASQQQLQPYLDALDTHNMLRTLIAPNVTTETVDPWYNTPIRIRPSSYVAAASNPSDLDQLHLPVANPFIASDLEGHARSGVSQPQQLVNKPGENVWFYPDSEFHQPVARMILQLQRQDLSEPRRLLIAQLYTRAVNEALNTYSYPASQAGLDYNLSASSQGILLSLNGYQDKQPELLSRVLKAMQSVSMSDDEFSRYQASVRRSLENQQKATPYERGLTELKRTIYEPSFSEEQLLAELPNVTRADVEQFAADLQATSATRLYIHGNISDERAQQLTSLIEQQYPATDGQQTSPQILRLPAGRYQKELGLEHPDKSLVLYMQGTDNSDHERATVALLGQILSAPYYQSIRTEQQLGYIVFATVYPQRSVPGLVFAVQSPTTGPAELYARSETFLNGYRATLAAMTDAEFASFQSGLVTLLTEPAKNMGEKAERFWRDLDIGRTSFDTNSAIAAEVAKVSRDEVVAMFDKMITRNEVPWLALVQGGSLEGWTAASSIDRSQLPVFNPRPAQ